MTENNERIAKLAKIWVNWNFHKISGDDAIYQIGKIFKKECLITLREFIKQEGNDRNSESKVVNLLANMENLPKNDCEAKIKVLIEIIEEQQRRIEDLEQTFMELPEMFELKEKMLSVDEVKRE